jgi:predicted TPR repeat methyltransferase
MPPVPSFRSSGDLLADRRYTYGRDSFEEGDFLAAADLAMQALELAPDFAAAHALLGRALVQLKDTEGAVSALKAALAADPEDALGVRIDLARLGALPPDEAIGEGYVRALFDDYAPQFERHLVKNLYYRGPELLAEALRWGAAKRKRSFRYDLALDLGCGTGLMARALGRDFGTIEGVDLSSRMLAAARKTKLYAALHEAELVAFLKGRRDGEADLIVAADVFVYMASLAEVFGEARRVLRPRGFFAFTVQAHEGGGYVLGDDARYAHGEPYLRDLAETAGFETVTLERVSTRQDRGEDVPGYLVILER